MRITLLVPILVMSLTMYACGDEAEVTNQESEAEDDSAGSQAGASADLVIGTPSSVAYNSTNGQVYVVYSDVDVMSVLDADTLEEVGTVDLPAGGLHSVGANPHTNKIYVANAGDGSVTVVDGATNEVIKEIPAPNGLVNSQNASVIVNADTNKIYVSRLQNNAAGSGRYGVSVIDGERDAVAGVIPLDGPGQAMVIDPSSNDVWGVTQSWAQLGEICPETSRVFHIDGLTDELVDCMEFGYNSLSVGVSADGSTLYHFAYPYSNPGAPAIATTLTTVELGTGRSLATIDYAEFGPGMLVVDADLDRLVILAPVPECCSSQVTPQLLAMEGPDVVWSTPFERSPVAFAPDFESGRYFVVMKERTLEVVEPDD